MIQIHEVVKEVEVPVSFIKEVVHQVVTEVRVEVPVVKEVIREVIKEGTLLRVRGMDELRLACARVL